LPSNGTNPSSIPAHHPSEREANFKTKPRPKIKFFGLMSKYRLNQLLFLLNTTVLLAGYYFVFTAQHSIVLSILWFFILTASLHYHFNLVHLASHQLLSKNRHLNSLLGNISAIFGGITFADFRLTHSLHHKNPTDSEADPDHVITQGHNFFILPFKIFYHDYYFWSKKLYKINKAWRGYLLDRFVQAGLVIASLLTGNISEWILFWLIPIFIIGFFNGMFLFYFPHYSTKLELNWRENLTKTKRNVLNLHQTISLTLIDISREYHTRHHKRIAENRNYFPVLSYILDKGLGIH
jgi:fatty acid desaturase